MELTRERLHAVLRYEPSTGAFIWLDTGTNNRHLIGKPAGSITNGYMTIRIDRRLHYAHRLAWFYVHGVWPPILDHADADRTNNRISNLRPASMSQNLANGPVRNNCSSGVPGVAFRKRERKWIAQVRHNYRVIHVGTFDTIDEARDARNAKAKEIWGEFARTY